ncbi:MAG: class I SAM-dependent methyltransferase [Anaerolineae bacterium]
MLSLERQEAYRRRYAGDNPSWRPATHLFRDLVAGHLTSTARVLDLGCGRGGVIEELHPRAGLALGLDADLDSLRGHRASALRRACGLAESLPYPDRSFDLICCSWVLEHLSDPGRAFGEVARLLTPGGHFIFVTPNRRHPLLILNRALGWIRGSQAKGRLVSWLYGRAPADTFSAFYRANTPGEIARWAENAGLAPVALHLVSDPTYLAFDEPSYRLACLLERALPSAWRVHLVGDCVLTRPPSSSRPGTAPDPHR